MAPPSVSPLPSSRSSGLSEHFSASERQVAWPLRVCTASEWQVAWPKTLNPPNVHRVQGGKLHLNSTHLVRAGGTTLLKKRGIWEAELREPAIQAAAPLCSQLQTDPTLRIMLGMHLPALRLQSQAVKLQYNAGMPRREPASTAFLASPFGFPFVGHGMTHLRFSYSHGCIALYCIQALGPVPSS